MISLVVQILLSSVTPIIIHYRHLQLRVYHFTFYRFVSCYMLSTICLFTIYERSARKFGYSMVHMQVTYNIRIRYKNSVSKF
ncbi:unnamed protein product [Schistosoma margrebowiei]|uniref:Uncharacterized protein n=1 Tax=Schistosoma margrebowiei TaxID=48269 RepID=A0AA85A151_9TREM|nr:unnamed protein product [Schistosoma margrebowiei]